MFEVRPGFLCETCSLQNDYPEMWYSWEDLIDHVSKRHWKFTRAHNNQQVYLCDHCTKETVMSAPAVVDCFGNLYCNFQCLGNAYKARLTTQRTIDLLGQQQRDEEYVRRSLGVQP